MTLRGVGIRRPSLDEPELEFLEAMGLEETASLLDEWSFAVDTPHRHKGGWPMRGFPSVLPSPPSIDDLIEAQRILLRKIDELQSALTDVRVGIGAIHSLDNGRVQLKYPLLYGYQEFDDEVLVSIGDLGITGVGVTENDAVYEAQQRLWAAYQHVRDMPVGSVGGKVVNIIRTIEWRIGDAVDA